MMLAVIMVVTLMPLIGRHAYAAGEDFDEEKVSSEEAEKVELGKDNTLDVELSDEEVKEAEEQALEEAKARAGIDDAVSIDEIEEAVEDEEDKSEELAGGYDEKLAKPADSGLAIKDGKNMKLSEDPQPYAYSLTVSEPDSNGFVTVTGYIGDAGYTFDSLYVGDEKVNFNGGDVTGLTSFTATVDMKNYEVGYHIIYAYLDYDGVPSNYYLYKDYVPTYIYGAPSNSQSYYETSVKYFTVYYPGSSYGYDYDCNVYLDYKMGKGKWKKGYGPVSEYSSSKSKRGGLKANKLIQIRLFYGKQFSYTDKGGYTGVYAFTGRQTGKMSRVVKVKTAYKKLKPRSISAYGARYKVTKYRYPYKVRYFTRWGILFRRTYYKTKKLYYTKFKIKVTFKKKPGIAGLYIGTHLKKGNKKKYVSNFTVYGKKKGKKVKLTLQSYRSSIYGGYSKLLRTKVRVR